jgi:hypothetical protein
MLEVVREDSHVCAWMSHSDLQEQILAFLDLHSC